MNAVTEHKSKLLQLPTGGSDSKDPSWSDSVNEILPGLFVGDYYAATCPDTLQLYNIEAIVNATWSSNKRLFKSKIAYHRVKIKDDGSSILTPHLAKANKFIHRQRRKLKKNVLIHCSAGMSRSVSLAIAYLFYIGHSSTFEEALKFMQTKRPCSRPSPSFTEELKAVVE
jgi:protein-tyrosine phosphatase